MLARALFYRTSTCFHHCGYRGNVHISDRTQEKRHALPFRQLSETGADNCQLLACADQRIGLGVLRGKYIVRVFKSDEYAKPAPTPDVDASIGGDPIDPGGRAAFCAIEPLCVVPDGEEDILNNILCIVGTTEIACSEEL